MQFFAKKVQADVSPDFRESRRESPVQVHQKLNDWCTVKKIVKGEESYYFMERAGVDSVAFILFDATKEKPFGIIHQYRGNFGEWQCGCFTGSLDKPELTIPEIVIEEVLEESGYTVDLSHVHKISTECAGSQSNERVHLFLVDVTGLIKGEEQPESVHEENTETCWVCEHGLMFCDDWKARLIYLMCLRDGRLVPPSVI